MTPTTPQLSTSSIPVRWLSPDTAVVYLDLPNKRYLYTLVRSRRIPVTRMGKSLKFDRFALDRFLEKRTVPAVV